MQLKTSILIFLIFVSATSSFVAGQTTDKEQIAKSITPKSEVTRNNIYAFTGTSLVFSAFTLVYERNIFSKPESQWNIRAGWGMNAIIWGNTTHHYLLNFCYVSGQKNHHFEACLGAAMLFDRSYYLYYKNDPNLYEPFTYFADWYPSAYLGYRFKKPDGKFLFRAGIGWPDQFGIGCGFSF